MSSNNHHHPDTKPDHNAQEQLAHKLETVVSFNSDNFKERVQDVNHF